MTLVDHYFEFEQTTPATTWDINFESLGIPGTAKYASVEKVFATGGEIIDLDSQLVAPDGLQLSFGVIPVAGKAIGKYYLESGGTVVTDSAGNVVNITVTQNGGAAPAGATF